MAFKIFLSFYLVLFSTHCFSSGPCASALDVAAYIVEKFEPDRVESLKLQKSLYFCQKESLRKNRIPLFEDDIEAWVHGPVVPGVYKNHRRQVFVTKELFGDSGKLAAQQKEIVEEIVTKYKETRGWCLREESHLEKPWIEARAGLDPGASSNAVITVEAILRSFEESERLCTYDSARGLVAKPTSFEELEKLKGIPVKGLDFTLYSFFDMEEVELLKEIENLSYINLRGVPISLEVVHALAFVLAPPSFEYLDICQTPAAEKDIISFIRDSPWKEKVIFIDRDYLGVEDVEKEFAEQLPYHIEYYKRNIWAKK